MSGDRHYACGPFFANVYVGMTGGAVHVDAVADIESGRLIILSMDFYRTRQDIRKFFTCMCNETACLIKRSSGDFHYSCGHLLVGKFATEQFKIVSICRFPGTLASPCDRTSTRTHILRGRCEEVADFKTETAGQMCELRVTQSRTAVLDFGKRRNRYAGELRKGAERNTTRSYDVAKTRSKIRRNVARGEGGFAGFYCFWSSAHRVVEKNCLEKCAVNMRIVQEFGSGRHPRGEGNA